MEFFKFNIPKPESEGGGFDVKCWSPKYEPVIENNEVKYIIHNVLDITEKYFVDKTYFQQVEQIKKINGMVIDREIKMIALKKENEKLRSQLNT